MLKPGRRSRPRAGGEPLSSHHQDLNWTQHLETPRSFPDSLPQSCLIHMGPVLACARVPSYFHISGWFSITLPFHYLLWTRSGLCPTWRFTSWADPEKLPPASEILTALRCHNDNTVVFDEGAEDKLRTKHKLTPRDTCPHGWDTCDVPQALPAALKPREGKTNG